MITFTHEECQAMYELIDQLSGGNAENVFLWDCTDSLADPTISAAAKLYTAAKAGVPDNLKQKW